MENVWLKKYVLLIPRFNQAAEKGSFHSFYYLGEMAENGDLSGGIDLPYAFECFSIAAANGSAQSLFKLAK